jgi:hypothetical protein
MSQSNSAKYARVSLRWDDITLGEQILASDDGQLDLERWKRIDLRLCPEWVGHSLTIYEQTLFLVTFEKVDATGRKLTR